MFGLTKREQRWKAEKQAAELLIGLAATTVRAAADVRTAEAMADAGELQRLRAENAELRTTGHANFLDNGRDEALMQEALHALEYHQEQTRPIEKTSLAICALRVRLAVNTQKGLIHGRPYQCNTEAGCGPDEHGRWACRCGRHSKA